MATKKKTTKASTGKSKQRGRATPITPRAGLKDTRYGCGGKLKK